VEKIITKNSGETQKLGENFARSLHTNIVCLYGDLGGGKTTFLQGFAKGLGVKEKVLSPTFVIYKKYNNFYHFDCYRINKPEEILELGWEKIIGDPNNIVAVEWPEKIKKYLPKKSASVKFKFIDSDTREIVIK